jgi:trypsin-like peptidase
MPKFGDYRYLLDAVVFVYRSKEDAESARKAGGTGFLIAVPSESAPESFHHIYAVTNVHVARGEPRALRVKVRVGGFDSVVVGNWTAARTGADVAVAPVELDPSRHVVEALRSDSWLLTRDECERLQIDAGDDVFMVGRFVDYEGVETNQPSLRFGHISIKGARVLQPATGYNGDSFVIDMHSRSGYSGSPVFVFRTHGSVFAKENSIVLGGHLMKVLGIHWGQFPERWDLVQGSRNSTDDAAEATLITEGAYVNGLSGMTCVAPSWDILALLADDELLESRKRVEREVGR